MTVIKKQVFRPSRDENLQQFLAKDGAEMRWGQPASKNKAKTRARAAGKIIGVPEKEGDAAKKTTPKAEPKSPWDDESDALDQGSDNSNSADDTTGKQIKLAIQEDMDKREHAYADVPYRKRKKLYSDIVAQTPEAQAAWRKENPGQSDPAIWADQAKDSQKAEQDDRTKEIKNAVEDAWFDKATSHGGWDETGSTHIPKGMGNELTSGKPGKKKAGGDGGMRLYAEEHGKPIRGGKEPEIARAKHIDALETSHRAFRRGQQESAKRPPGKGQKAKWVAEDYDADEDGPHKVEGHWESKMQKAVWDAWFEKARSRRNQEKVRETRRRWRGDDSPPKNRQDRALTSQTLEEERDWQNDPYRPSLDAGETEWSYRQAAKPDEKTRRRRYRKHQGDSNRDITTQVSNPERKPLSEYGNKRTKKLVGRARKEQRSPAVKANRKASNAESSLPNRSNYSASDQYAHDMKEARRKIADG